MSMNLLVLFKRHRNYNYPQNRFPILISLIAITILTLAYNTRLVRAASANTETTNMPSLGTEHHNAHRHHHHQHSQQQDQNHTSDDESLKQPQLRYTINVVADDEHVNVRHRRHRNLQKRDFYPICKGVYDKSIYARLDRICEDCFNLFHEPELHLLCRSDCFTTKYFKGCVETLLLTDEMKKFTEMIEFLGGK